MSFLWQYLHFYNEKAHRNENILNLLKEKSIILNKSSDLYQTAMNRTHQGSSKLFKMSLYNKYWVIFREETTQQYQLIVILF